MKILVWIIASCALIVPGLAQDIGSAPSTRAELIENQRREKAARLTPERPGSAERRFVSVKESALHILGGNPQIVVGGLPNGSGFALGPGLDWSNATDSFQMNASAVSSVTGAYQVIAGFSFPRFGSRRLSLSVQASHSDFPRMAYYGPGPDSKKGGRTDYRREDTVGEAALRWNAIRKHLTMGLSGGELLVNVGPGTNPRIASAETVYRPAEAPGIDEQTNFVRGSSFVDLDYRDFAGDPHKGARLYLQYDHYSDIKLERYSFGKMKADMQFYLPYFNRKRVIALRAKTELTDPDRNEIVPFYLQPSLGDAGDFRGFRPFRFRDNNLVLFNAEYRWEVSSGFDVALFGDGGRVFERARDIRVSHLETAGGFGLRFKNRESVIMRIDTGFSREGFQIWFKFGNVF